MIQWFRGSLDASYVGTPTVQPLSSTRAGAAHYKLRIYRAAIRDLEPIAAPDAVDGEDRAEPSGDTFHQERIDEAHLAGIRGKGSSFVGPIFAVRVSAASLLPLAHKDGRSYGRIRGSALAYCRLPAEAAQPEVETETVAAERPPEPGQPEPPLRAELRQAAEGEPPLHSRAEPRASTAPKPAADEPVARDADQTEKSVAAPSVARKQTHAGESALPLFSVVAAVALGLWVTCGGPPALLWSLFLLPTLGARKLFHGVVGDSNGIRAFGVLLMIVQLLCVSTLLSEWWSADCKELRLLPLIGIVSVIFPAGLLPSVLPLGFTSASLGLVLAVWCGGAAGMCHEQPRTHEPAARPSVEHPGVPRTNEDGTWPRRPPGE